MPQPAKSLIKTVAIPERKNGKAGARAYKVGCAAAGNFDLCAVLS